MVQWLTSPPNAGRVGAVPGREAKILQCLTAKKAKHKTEAINIVRDSIKTLKMGHIKKKKTLKNFKKITDTVMSWPKGAWGCGAESL